MILKNKNYGVVLIALLFSSVFINAQSNKKDDDIITTKPFSDSEKHWYGIKDKNNLVDPMPNQPKYSESDYTKIAD
ncbi:MAG: pectate lyase, partial [Flavobacterium sp.]